MKDNQKRAIQTNISISKSIKCRTENERFPRAKIFEGLNFACFPAILFKSRLFRRKIVKKRPKYKRFKKVFKTRKTRKSVPSGRGPTLANKWYSFFSSHIVPLRCRIWHQLRASMLWIQSWTKMKFETCSLFDLVYLVPKWNRQMIYQDN